MGSPVRRPDLVDSIAGAISIIADRKFDRRWGTSTRLSILKVIQDPATRGPQPTPERVAHAALSAVPADRSGIFVDVGAGSGRMLIMAHELGWRRVVGVEHSGEAIAQTRENIDRYVATAGADTSWVELVHQDAAQFDPPEETRTVFLFNPFGRETTESFVRRLEPVAGRSHGALRVVYVFPVFGNVFDESPAFELERVGKTGGFPWVVFRAVVPSGVETPDSRRSPAQ